MTRAGRLLRLLVLLVAAVVIFAGVALLLTAASLLYAAAIAYKTVHNGLTARPDPAVGYARDGIADLERHLAKETDR